MSDNVVASQVVACTPGVMENNLNAFGAIHGEVVRSCPLVDII